VRGWLAGFQGAEVRSTARKVFVDGGDHNARVHGFAIRLQHEVEIHGVVNGVAIDVVGRRQLLEDVEVELNGVGFLARRSLELLQR